MAGNRMQDSIVVGGTDEVGQPLDRVDGRLKVTGSARYAAEHLFSNLAHAVAITSTIAHGRITKIDTSAAKGLPGVLTIITHENVAKMKSSSRDKSETKGQFGQTLAPLQDDEIHFGGQYVAVVVAEDLDVARQAAELVKIEYAEEPVVIDMTKPIGDLVVPKKMARDDKPDSDRGNADSNFETSPVKVKQTYITPVQNHNPMEMHATIAVWEGDRLTLYDSTQHVLGVKSLTAFTLGISADNIRVISPFLGGGFGCKGSVWPHIPLAAVAAQAVKRPVKLVLTRQQMFTQVGYRPRTIQDLSLGADNNGKLLAITHDTINQTADFDEWTEPAGKPTKFLYSCSNVRITHRLARVNASVPCQMRAPGEALGTYSLEAAMDELAYAANVDPLELRLRNYAEKDEGDDKPYSSKALRECYRLGAERFGWAKRSAEPRSMKDGNILIGWGMATATYPTNVSPSSASVRLFPDGRAVVTAATHDLGTGTYTIMTQIAAQALGLKPERVKFDLGDSMYPEAPVAGGSQTAASVGSAVLKTCQLVVEKVAKMAVKDSASPLHGKDADDLVLANGRVQLKSDGNVGESLADLLGRAGNRPVEAIGKTDPPTEKKDKYSKHAWGAQFAEVRIDEPLGEVRVSRAVGAFAAGRILNVKTATSQVMGGMVMGIGMALYEHTVYDPNRGTVVTDNLADYLVPVNADIPAIECFFVDEVDDHANPIGAKGVGELGITGIAAAVANAVYHATGRRIRELPITCDKLL